MMGQNLRRALPLLAAACALFALPSAAQAVERADSQGRDFWIAFPGNFGTTNETLFLTGDTATTGTVEIPGAGFSQPFSITPGTVTTVALPDVDLKTGDGVEEAAVHVSAAHEVTVYGLNRRQFTTDAFLGLPTDVLGTEHTVLAWDEGQGGRSQLAVVASQDATTVTITPSVAVGGHAAGVPYDITLDRGDAYQGRAAIIHEDVTGTRISSTKPIAVLGGHQCANIPSNATLACDHLVEQQPPDDAFGESFLTVPLATRVGGDTFRVMASQNATAVQIDGTTVATLDRGQFHEQLITAPSVITADKPVLVAQYSNGTTFDGVTSDPFMMLIPPFEQFLQGYTVTTPASGFVKNFVNLVVPDSEVGVVEVDGTPVPASAYQPIGTSGYQGAQVEVALGSHTLTGAGEPFGAFVYGFDSADSYGYPGGLSVAPIARVTSVTLTPATATHTVGTQGCVTALVKDQNGNPVPDVRVDFDRTGANPGSASQNADASGQAEHCYTGTNTGEDTITGAVGTVSGTAKKTWVAARRATKLVADPLILRIQGLKVYLAPQATLFALNPTEPLGGKTITFKAGSSSICSAVTNSAGVARCSGLMPLVSGVLALGNYTASFSGDANYFGSSDQAALIK